MNKKTKTFDIIEGAGKGSFNFYDLSLGKSTSIVIETSKMKEYVPDTIPNQEQNFEGRTVFTFDNCELYGFSMKSPNGKIEKYTPIDKAIFSANDLGESLIEYPVRGENGNSFVFAVIGYDRIVFRYADRNYEFIK